MPLDKATQDQRSERILPTADLHSITSKQSALDALLTSIEQVQSEHEKFSSEKRFLEDYIGNLMVKTC